MIYLRGAACLVRAAGGAVFLAPTDLDIPSDRSIAILGGSAGARTALLQLIARRRRPDAGAVAHACRVSPVLNDERLLHPALTGLANLRFVARANLVDEASLIRAVDAFCGLAGRLTEPVRSLDGGSRRVLEAAIVSALGYDLVLLDDAQQFPLPTIGALRDAAHAAGAGFIFASAGPRPVQSFADLVLVLDGERLRLETDPGLAAARIERSAA
jgi:ABC-type polysaccharide/polyol phosphate transport system ATPase subunit